MFKILCAQTRHTQREHVLVWIKTLRYAFTFSYLLKYASQRLGNYFQNHAAKQHSVMDNELCEPFQVRPLEQQKHSPIRETNLSVCLWHELIQRRAVFHPSANKRQSRAACIHWRSNIHWINRLYQLINICFLIQRKSWNEKFYVVDGILCEKKELKMRKIQ